MFARHQVWDANGVVFKGDFVILMFSLQAMSFEITIDKYIRTNKSQHFKSRNNNEEGAQCTKVNKVNKVVNKVNKVNKVVNKVNKVK